MGLGGSGVLGSGSTTCMTSLRLGQGASSPLASAGQSGPGNRQMMNFLQESLLCTCPGRSPWVLGDSRVETDEDRMSYWDNWLWAARS